MTNANEFEQIDPIIKKAAGRSFSVGPSTLDYLRDIGLTVMKEAPSARSGAMVARASVAVEIAALKLTDLDVDSMLARRDAEPQAHQ